MSTETVVKPEQFDILDDQTRTVSGWASIQVLDKQNDIVPVAEMQKGMLTLMDRGANIMYAHSNKPVGKVLQWETKQHPTAKTLGIHMIVKFYKDYPVDDIVWDKVKKGELTGFSIGATAREEKRTLNEGINGLSKEVGVLHDISLMEISVVEKPACPLALIDEINYFAKSDAVVPLVDTQKDGYIGGQDGNIMSSVGGKAGKSIKPFGEIDVKKPKKKSLDFDYLADDFSKSWQKEKKEHKWLSEAEAKRVDSDHKREESKKAAGVDDVDNTSSDIEASAGKKRKKLSESLKESDFALTTKGFSMWVEVGKATRKVRGMKSIQSLAKYNHRNKTNMFVCDECEHEKRFRNEGQLSRHKDVWHGKEKADDDVVEQIDGKCPKCGKPYDECECKEKKKVAEKDESEAREEREERDSKEHEDKEKPSKERAEREGAREEREEEESEKKKGSRFSKTEHGTWKCNSRPQEFKSAHTARMHEIEHRVIEKLDVKKDLRCPRCGKMIPESRYNAHLAECQGSQASKSMLDAVAKCSKKVKSCVADVKGKGEAVNPYAVCQASVKKAMMSCEKVKAKAKSIKQPFKAGLDNKQIATAGGDVGNATLFTSYKADETVERIPVCDDPQKLNREVAEDDKFAKLTKDSIDMMTTVKKAVIKKKEPQKRMTYRQAKTVVSNLLNAPQSRKHFADANWKERNKELLDKVKNLKNQKSPYEGGALIYMRTKKPEALRKGSDEMLEAVEKARKKVGRAGNPSGINRHSSNLCPDCETRFKSPDDLQQHQNRAHTEGRITNPKAMGAMDKVRLHNQEVSGKVKVPKHQPSEAKKPKPVPEAGEGRGSRPKIESMWGEGGKPKPPEKKPAYWRSEVFRY